MRDRGSSHRWRRVFAQRQTKERKSAAAGAAELKYYSRTLQFFLEKDKNSKNIHFCINVRSEILTRSVFPAPYERLNKVRFLSETRKFLSVNDLAFAFINL